MKHKEQCQEIFHAVQPRHGKEHLKSTRDTHNSCIFAVYC